jgi:hypothetical protein
MVISPHEGHGTTASCSRLCIKCNCCGSWLARARWSSPVACSKSGLGNRDRLIVRVSSQTCTLMHVDDYSMIDATRSCCETVTPWCSGHSEFQERCQRVYVVRRQSKFWVPGLTHGHGHGRVAIGARGEGKDGCLDGGFAWDLLVCSHVHVREMMDRWAEAHGRGQRTAARKVTSLRLLSPAIACSGAALRAVRTCICRDGALQQRVLARDAGHCGSGALGRH